MSAPVQKLLSVYSKAYNPLFVAFLLNLFGKQQSVSETPPAQTSTQRDAAAVFFLFLFFFFLKKTFLSVVVVALSLAEWISDRQAGDLQGRFG